MPDPWPAPTWPEGLVPTNDQLREFIDAHSPGAGHDGRVAARMILGMLVERERYLETLEAYNAQLLAERRRYRLAWKSARVGRLRARLALGALASGRIVVRGKP